MAEKILSNQADRSWSAKANPVVAGRTLAALRGGQGLKGGTMNDYDKSWGDLKITIDDIWDALSRMAVEKGLDEEEAKSVLKECRKEFLDRCKKVPGGLPEDFADLKKSKTWESGELFFDILRETFNDVLKKRIM